MVDIHETAWEGVCLNKYILVEMWQERVFLIKTYQATWHASQYPSPPIQNGLYDVCVCVKEKHQKNDRGKNERERGRASASEGKRGRGREKERTRVFRFTYQHHSSQFLNHYIHHCTVVIAVRKFFWWVVYCAAGDFFLIKCFGFWFVVKLE